MTILILLVVVAAVWAALEASERRYRHSPHAGGPEADRRRVEAELRAAEQRRGTSRV